MVAEPSTAGAFCSRLQPQWGLPPHPSKSTEPTGLLHLPDGLRWEGGGGIEAACPMGRNYSAVWTSSVLRAAANASLSTGGMHLMLAGLPHSFTVGVCSIKHLFPACHGPLGLLLSLDHHAPPTPLWVAAQLQIQASITAEACPRLPCACVPMQLKLDTALGQCLATEHCARTCFCRDTSGLLTRVQ